MLMLMMSAAAAAAAMLYAAAAAAMMIFAYAPNCRLVIVSLPRQPAATLRYASLERADEQQSLRERWRGERIAR